MCVFGFGLGGGGVESWGEITFECQQWKEYVISNTSTCEKQLTITRYRNDSLRKATYNHQRSQRFLIWATRMYLPEWYFSGLNSKYSLMFLSSIISTQGVGGITRQNIGKTKFWLVNGQQGFSDARNNMTIWGQVCQKQVSRAGTNNYIPQYLWGVITCPCPWYLLLAHKSACRMMGCNHSFMPYFQGRFS